MAKNQNLNLANLKKEVKKVESQSETSIFINETEYKLKVDDNFLPTKMHELLDDLVEFLNEANDKVKLLDIANPYITLLLIKHFTSLDISDDIDEAVDALRVFVDLDILHDILNAMPEKEVVKVYELIATTVNRMQENMEITAEEAEKMAEVVESPVLKDALLNGKTEQ
jgi:hypothetical protein